jgi:hypothetical protein
MANGWTHRKPAAPQGVVLRGHVVPVLVHLESSGCNCGGEDGRFRVAGRYSRLVSHILGNIQIHDTLETWKCDMDHRSIVWLLEEVV